MFLNREDRAALHDVTGHAVEKAKQTANAAMALEGLTALDAQTALNVIQVFIEDHGEIAPAALDELANKIGRHAHELGRKA